jgi:tRNA 2-selenouridine synthase SelU
MTRRANFKDHQCILLDKNLFAGNLGLLLKSFTQISKTQKTHKRIENKNTLTIWWMDAFKKFLEHTQFQETKWIAKRILKGPKDAKSKTWLEQCDSAALLRSSATV